MTTAATNQEFNGDIDDVLVYSRVLAQPEIQALVQQPNKRIFVTAINYGGDLRTIVSGAPTGTGIAGADAKCNADTNIPNTSNYKAMIIDGNIRRACTTGNCVGTAPLSGLIEQKDWVLQPNVTYIRPDALTPTLMLSVFTADWNGVWNFGGTAPTGGSLSNAISGPVINDNIWTGLDGAWLLSTFGNCTGWSDSTPAVSGDDAGANSIGASAISWSGGSSCNIPQRLYCVEQ